MSADMMDILRILSNPGESSKEVTFEVSAFLSTAEQMAAKASATQNTQQALVSEDAHKQGKRSWQSSRRCDSHHNLP